MRRLKIIIFQSFDLSDNDNKKYQAVKNKFDSHFVTRKNITYEWAIFSRHKQEEGESVDTFITALYTLSEHCNYGVLTEEMIRDLIVGLRDSNLSLKQQLDEKLDLHKAITQVREAETIIKYAAAARIEKSTKGGYRKCEHSPQEVQQARVETPTTTGAKSTTMQQCVYRCRKSPSNDHQHMPGQR